MKRFWTYLLLSFFLVAFGQPAWVPAAGILASLGGYALFWMGMLTLPGRMHRFFLSVVWFMAVHAVQLSWMTETHYMGPLILGVYACLLLGLGLQFGLFSSFLDPEKPLSLFKCAALSGGFVLLEGMRLYLLSGFTWNPAGLSLAVNPYSLQFAALFGIYGLSYWVIFVNLCALSFFQTALPKKGVAWVSLALLPYVFGGGYMVWVKSHFLPEREISVALIDTGLKVEEKNWDRKKPHSFIPPLEQWKRVWGYLKKDKPVDLIVLPEAAFPYGSDAPFCTLENFRECWVAHFGLESVKDFPIFTPPFVVFYEWQGKEYFGLTNTFFAQTLANHFNADLIIGLDYDDGEDLKTNAAFLIRPHKMPERYDKRILAPIGEYIPFSNIQWISDFVAQEFGISNSFDVGEKAKVFQSHLPIGVPICLEETHSHLVWDLRKRGAKLLVSLSNDVWFPSSRLARQHFDHGRIRAVENGLYLLRSSNMGVTGGVDYLGQTIDTRSAEKPGAIYLSIPIFSEATPFSYWGDTPIFLFSLLIFPLFFLRKRTE
jgi:apolipoprotein N-acyltransferase